MFASQTTAGGGDAVGTAVGIAVSAAAADGAAPAQDNPAQDADEMQIDSWESVSQQPSW